MSFKHAGVVSSLQVSCLPQPAFLEFYEEEFKRYPSAAGFI